MPNYGSAINRHNRYGCVRCQKHHYEGASLYAAHWTYMSKHGLQLVSGREWATQRLQEAAL